MFKQVIELTRVSKLYFQNQHQRRLFFDLSFVTSCLLFTLCAIVTSQQYFGKPIECMQSSGLDASIPETVLNKFCFISPTYTPVNFQDVNAASNNEKKYSIYPWVPIIMLLQGLSFLSPLSFWAYLDGGFLEKCLRDRNSVIVDNKKLQPLGRYLAKRMGSFKTWSVGYIFSEFIFIINMLFNLVLTDIFLGGSFLFYGYQVFENSSIGSSPFPTMTRCDFHKFGPSGTLENRDILCVMTLNMLNEKFYLLLWFWFSFVVMISGLLLLQRILFLFVLLLRKKCIPLIKLMLLPQLGCNGVFVLINNLTITDWILIQQLKKSMYPVSYSVLLENIVIEMSDHHNLIFNGVKDPSIYKKKLRDTSWDSNSNI